MTAQISSPTVPALSSAIKSLLTRAGADNPDGDTREILCSVLNCSHTELILRDEPISEEESEKALSMARRRASGEPIQYVTGVWSFMGRDYSVGRGVLIPRDDTEVVVSEALRLIKGVNAPRVIDLCSGSGIIAITLKNELPFAEVCAVEKSPEACAYLRKNAELNASDIVIKEADIFACHKDFDDASFDMIISNPPYIMSAEIASLQSEVQYEPRLALDGGESGYDFYEGIISMWTPKLKDGGYLALEIGEGQFGHISELLKSAGFTDITGYPDIQGTTRAVSAKKDVIPRSK